MDYRPQIDLVETMRALKEIINLVNRYKGRYLPAAKAAETIGRALDIIVTATEVSVNGQEDDNEAVAKQ